MAGSQSDVIPSSILIYPANPPSTAISPGSLSQGCSLASEKRTKDTGRMIPPVADMSSLESPNNETSVILNNPSSEHYPEGGYGWFVVAGAFVLSFWTLGMGLCYGVFQEYFLDSQLFPNSSAQSISWVGSLGISSLFVAAPAIVVLNARLGSRRVLCIGTFVSSAGYIASSFSTASWHLYFTLSIPVGLGGCIIYFTATTVVSQYFYTRRAFALGIAAAGSSIGGTILSPFIRYLLTKLGFPNTARILGCMLFVCIGIASQFIRPFIPSSGPVPNKRDAESTAEESGREEGDSPRNTETSSLTVVLPEPKMNLDYTVLKSLNYALLFLATILFAISFMTPILLIPSYATSIGLSTSQSALLVSISSVTTIVSRVALGHVADRCGLLNTMLVCTLVAGVSCLALWMPAHSFETLAAFMGVFGGFQGTLILLFPVAASKAVTLDRVPSAMSFIFFATSLGYILGAPLTSLIIASEHGGNRGAAVFVGVIDFACFVLVAVIRLRTSQRPFAAV